MKVSFTLLTIIAAGFLLLAASCQQTNKGGSKSRWQLQSPGTAAGYGTPPLDTDKAKDTSPAPPKEPEPLSQKPATKNAKDTSPAPPADEKSQPEAPPAMVEPVPSLQQPATKNDGAKPHAPVLKIVPPPSAAGYGTLPLDTDKAKDTLPAPPADEKNLPEATPAKKQPATENDGTKPHTPTWKIVPPPSAAGYGK